MIPPEISTVDMDISDGVPYSPLHERHTLRSPGIGEVERIKELVRTLTQTEALGAKYDLLEKIESAQRHMNTASTEEVRVQYGKELEANRECDKILCDVHPELDWDSKDLDMSRCSVTNSKYSPGTPDL